MRYQVGVWLGMAASFAYLLPFASSLPANFDLKQTNRREVVEKQSKRLFAPLRPRTSSTPCVTPSGTYPGTTSNGDYSNHVATTGQIYNPLLDNPGENISSLPAYSEDDIGTAVNDCANFAESQYPGGAFQVYFQPSLCSWTCSAYQHSTPFPSDAYVSDPAVTLSYGYDEIPG